MTSVPPKIEKLGFRDLRIKVGQPIRFSVRLLGEPIPESDWTLNGKPLKPSNTIALQVTDREAKLDVRHARREDSGEYTLIAKNSSGTDSVSATVTVVGELFYRQ